MKKLRLEYTNTSCKNNHLIVVVSLIAFSFFYNAVYAQNTKPKSKFKVTGGINLSQDFFLYQSNDTLFRPYRPKSFTRIAAYTTFSYGKFSLPFSFSYILQQKGSENINSPIPSSFSLKDLLNNYNQLSFSPTFGKLQINLVTQVPKYSELSCGDLPIFGVGFDWKPKRFRAAAFYGISQRGISSDSINRVVGSYQRTSFGGKLGLGEEEKSHFYINLVKHDDDINSAVVNSQGLLPQENLVISIDNKLVFLKKFFIKSELGLSAYSNNLKIGTLESDSITLSINPILKSLFKPRFSSSYGAAFVGSFGYKGIYWGFTTLGRAYSPEYRTLSYPFFQSDRIEWLVEPYFILFKSKVSLNGSIGVRKDNFFAKKLTVNTQTIGSANLTIMPTSNWMINLMYANFGMQNNIANDTLRIQNIFSSYGINTSYTILRKKFNHVIMFSFFKNEFEDFNIVSGNFSNNITTTNTLGYSLNFLKIPLTLSTSGTIAENTIFLGTLKINMASINANYVLGKSKKTNIGLGFNIIQTKLIESTPDLNFTNTLTLSYKLAKKLNIGTNATLNLLRYGSIKPGIANTESSIRLFANYSF
ncbi:MAG: hypothetical protein ACOYMA_08655 [Bacteroidia bacterium]